MPALSSSVIQTVDYDRKTQTLSIRFRPSGRLYTYEKVPESVYQRLITASSAGQFFNFYIRDRYVSRQEAA